VVDSLTEYRVRLQRAYLSSAEKSRPAIASDTDAGSYANLQGVGRAMAVLERLAEGGMRPKELSQELGLKWTTLYRTLAYLHDHGYLERDEASGTYYVGARLYYIGSSYVNHLPMMQGAPPYLKAAADELGATAQLCERSGRRSMVLLVSEPAGGEYIPKTTIGFHFPLHCGAKGQVLLAYASPEQIEDYLAEPLQQLTPHTITDPDVLREQLQQIRADGYSLTMRDVQLSTAAAACPIMDAAGNVTASLSLIVSYAEFAKKKARLVDATSRTAQAISMLNGWRPEIGTRQAEDAPAGGAKARRGRRASAPR
jgi:DNA-binding IclR family transcriptional regulator